VRRTTVELREIRLNEIQPPPPSARGFLRDVASLAASMQGSGLQQPISVRLDGDKYVLTCGLRRFGAARRVDLDNNSHIRAQHERR
jgi:ParB-like chromosome segregation protein Spo0J